MDPFLLNLRVCFPVFPWRCCRAPALVPVAVVIVILVVVVVVVVAVVVACFLQQRWRGVGGRAQRLPPRRWCSRCCTAFLLDAGRHWCFLKLDGGWGEGAPRILTLVFCCCCCCCCWLLLFLSSAEPFLVGSHLEDNILLERGWEGRRSKAGGGLGGRAQRLPPRRWCSRCCIAFLLDAGRHWCF